MRYEALRHYSMEEINKIISSSDEEKIKLLPLSIGEYHDDFTYAKNFCLNLLESGFNDEVRANSVLGLSYLVRRFRQLDNTIMSRLQKELNMNEIFKKRVEYSIEDINLFMGW